MGSKPRPLPNFHSTIPQTSVYCPASTILSNTFSHRELLERYFNSKWHRFFIMIIEFGYYKILDGLTQGVKLPVGYDFTLP
jgi:hypothetical protein